MFKKLFLIFALFGLFINPSLFAQEDHSGCADETESSVKELDEMHEIIYPIWHQAYPEKDIPKLKEYVVEVNKYVERVYSAKLPGILQDKKTKWDEGVKELKKSVDHYNEVTKGDDEEAILKAAEDLHAKYEMLVRVIRPLNKEVDEFHKVLYMIYHHYLPEKNYNKIKEVSNDLLKKSEAIGKVKLSKRNESKQAQYEKAADDLVKACKNLDKVAKGKDKKAVNKAVENVHDKYVAIEKIFD